MRKPLLPLLATAVLLLGGLWAGQNLGTSSTAPSTAGTSSPDMTSPVASSAAGDARPPAPDAPRSEWPGFLPEQARHTVVLINQGGPFPYRQDGSVFGNREGRLPRRERGWYREYTVDTPGLRHRGARRIVTGGHPPSEWHYTGDHYESFRRFTPPATRETRQ